MDGPTDAYDDIPAGYHLHEDADWCEVLVPNDAGCHVIAPVEPDDQPPPVGRWIAPRGGYLQTEDVPDELTDRAFLATLPRPVGAVAACSELPEVLVVACARVEYERFARVVAGASGWPLPAWDDEISWRRSTFAREVRVDAMRSRLAVLWPVLVEHFGGVDA